MSQPPQSQLPPCPHDDDPPPPDHRSYLWVPALMLLGLVCTLAGWLAGHTLVTPILHYIEHKP
jgi:hypothetical protein